ncbi:VOC family protein [Fictibacillus barbaricus]|uniref:PhnB protein n=1 Tax=Fictibacillus barbaricus TaxID=182136 RepID=A0ABU1U0S5_9BACL|nr:VOC family protein [Fictibacillus barbaricus]MDR7073055.1 PhnB protein [Fictibacillus barbaricus]
MSIKTSIAPWLPVSSGVEAVDFYCNAFDSVEIYRLEEGEGNVIIAQLSVDGADFWIQENPGSSTKESVRMIMTVNDPDSVFEKALAAGAEKITPVYEEHGWRIGRIMDPFGHHWEIGKPLGKKAE